MKKDKKMELRTILISKEEGFKSILDKYTNMINTLFLNHDIKIEITKTIETEMYDQLVQEIKSIVDSKVCPYDMTFEEDEIYGGFMLFINISNITAILTFGLGSKAFINVCLNEDIDGEKVPSDHYTFMSKLSKIVSPMYNSILNTLLNNFDMQYDCCICGSYR